MFKTIRTAIFSLIICISTISYLLADIQIHEHSELYEISGISVNAFGESAVQAKDEAIIGGQQRAFQILLERILPAEHRSIAASLSSDEFLEDFQIQNEKVSSQRYIGTLTYRFNKPLLKSKLESVGLQSAAIVSVPYLIIPVLIQNGKTILWGYENAWLQMWANQAIRNSQISIIAPLGDLNDIVTLKTEDVLAQSATPIEKLIHKYRTQAAVIAIYEHPHLTLHIIQDGQVETLPLSNIPHLKEKHPDYTALIAPLLEALTNRTQQRPIQTDHPSEISVLLYTPTIRDLVKIKGALAHIPMVDEVNIHTMSIGWTQATLKVSGPMTTLGLELHKYGLTLQRGQSGEWQITRTQAS